MHNHDKSDDGMKSMMWMMIICCTVPLFLILVLGAGGKALGTPTWVVLGGVAVMAIIHFWIMSKGHKGRNEDGKTNISGESETKDKHKHSCH